MWVSTVTLLLLALLTASATDTRHNQPFVVRPIEEVARALGYEVERHNITTSDGYILTYHRLPRGRCLHRGDEPPHQRKVLMFNNGILLSSASVLANRKDFAYEFADAGFDVWLGNYRGNMYSRRHRFLDPDRDTQFWDYSVRVRERGVRRVAGQLPWQHVLSEKQVLDPDRDTQLSDYSLHELGTQDLPASIDYILGVTGASRLLYVGISMGTTMFWVLGAARPQYMEKVEAMVAIAPVARTSHTSIINSPFRCNNAQTVLSGMEALGYREVFCYNETSASMVHTGCTRSWLWRPLCLLLLNTFQYFSRNNWEIMRILEGIKYAPAGIATKVFHHYIQIAKARTFQQFDYGPVGNRRRYQTEAPPEYDLGNINCSKIYIVNSDADMIADKEDVEWLLERLPVRPTRILSENVKHLSHLGVGLDKRVMDIVVSPLADFLRRHHLS